MYAFIHIEKTGGTTMKWILRSSFGLHHCDVESWHSRFIPFSAVDLQRLRRLYPQLKSIAGHRVLPYSDLERTCSHIQYFTLMRDPLKRLASFHQFIVHRRAKNHVFEDWILKDDIRNDQTRKIAGVADADAAIQIIRDKGIFVGLTERYDESLVLLMSLFVNDLNISYKPIFVARDNSLAKSMLTNTRTLQMLIDANRADLELYNYVKQELYPSYQREYGSSTLSQDVVHYQQNREGFNRRNVMLNRLRRNLVYKPAQNLYRLWLSGVKHVSTERAPPGMT